jgi:hypothetical protein
MRIQKLLDAYLPDGEIRRYADGMIEKKRSGGETDPAHRSECFENFLTANLDDLMKHPPKNTGRHPVEAFDAVFRELIQS